MIVAELSWKMGQRSHRYGVLGQTLPSRASVLDNKGKVCSRFGLPGADGVLSAPHGLAIDSHGDLYVSHVAYSFAKEGRDLLAYDPDSAPTIQKFRRRRELA
jgi:hypothetical protein